MQHGRQLPRVVGVGMHAARARTHTETARAGHAAPSRKTMVDRRDAAEDAQLVMSAGMGRQGSRRSHKQNTTPRSTAAVGPVQVKTTHICVGRTGPHLRSLTRCGPTCKRISPTKIIMKRKMNMWMRSNISISSSCVPKICAGGIPRRSRRCNVRWDTMLDEIPCLAGYMPGGIPCGVGYRVGYIRWYAGLDGKKDEHGDAPVTNNGTR